MKEIYKKLNNIFYNKNERLAFSELIKDHKTRDKKINSFVSILHLNNQQKIGVEQEGRVEEIWILLKEMYETQNKEKLDRLILEAKENLD